MEETIKTMKIFLDTADTDLIKKGYATGLIDGVTTGITIVALQFKCFADKATP